MVRISAELTDILPAGFREFSQPLPTNFGTVPTVFCIVYFMYIYSYLLLV